MKYLTLQGHTTKKEGGGFNNYYMPFEIKDGKVVLDHDKFFELIMNPDYKFVFDQETIDRWNNMDEYLK